MRSVFLQNSLNLETNIREQIRDLNALVESYAIEQVYKEAISYLKYKRDASNMYALLALPSNSSTRGKTLELQRFVLNIYLQINKYIFVKLFINQLLQY